MKLPIDGCSIVGAMLPPRGKASFDEADVVVKHDGVIVRVREYFESELNGDEYTDEQWAAFIADHQATAIGSDEPILLEATTVLWALRADFDDRDAALRELRTSGALVVDVIEADEDARLCLVYGPQAPPLRSQWAQRAYSKARGHAEASCWAECLRCSEQAFALSPELREQEVALLVAAYERTGRGTRAKGYLQLCENSKGKDFRLTVEKHKQALLASLGVGPHPGLASGRRRSAWGPKAKKHLIASMGRGPKKEAA